MNAQEIRADGWEHDATRHRAVASKLARENHQLRARIADLEGALALVARDWALAVSVPGTAGLRATVAGHAATLAEWAAHLPARRIPARARLALAELERLGNAPARPPAPRTPPDDDAPGSRDG